MKRISQLPAVDSSFAVRSCSRIRISPFNRRYLHTTPVKPATVAPITASGPPPSAPIASADHVDSRVARRRKQAELLKRGRDLRSIAAGSGGGTAKQKRFWNDVHVKHADGKLFLCTIYGTYLKWIAEFNFCHRRSTSSPRQTPHPPLLKSHPQCATPQTTSCNCRGSRMGPPGLFPASLEKRPNTSYIPRLSGP